MQPPARAVTPHAGLHICCGCVLTELLSILRWLNCRISYDKVTEGYISKHECHAYITAWTWYMQTSFDVVVRGTVGVHWVGDDTG